MWDVPGYRRPVLRRLAVLALPLLLATLLSLPWRAHVRRERRGPAARDAPGPAHVVERYADFKAGQRTGLKMGRGQVSAAEGQAPHRRGQVLRGRHLDLALGHAGLRRHRAHPVVGGHHARRTAGRASRCGRRTPAAARHAGTRVADWARTNRPVPRTTYSGQADDLGRVNVDTWSPPTAVTAWQVRVTLMRADRDRARPCSLERVGAVASADASAPRATSQPGPAARHRPARADVLPDGPLRPLPRVGWRRRGVVLAHVAGDGARPTTASPRRPPASRPATPTPSVDHAAKMVYDNGYAAPATGPSTPPTPRRSPAATPTSPGCATCARPRTTSSPGCRWSSRSPSGAASSTGAPISASNGHLLVIVGFEADGDVVVNDPAGATNADVRRIYDRAQFEDLARRLRRDGVRRPQPLTAGVRAA